MKTRDTDPSGSSTAEVTLPPDAGTDEIVASLRTMTRYDDLGLLGEGGLGEVRRVHDRELDRVVAMKILRDDVPATPATLTRFLEEARLSARLQHPGIVPVHDVGRRPDGRLYFTMQVVNGRTLREGIREWHLAARAGREVRWRSLVEPFARVCEAVAYAHGEGIVHRDLKPSNVMLGVHGRVLVLDWGLAAVLGQGLGPHRVVGTPAYMPPEQAVGDEARLGPTADVWGLGAVLVELLTGAPPWGSLGKADTLKALQRGEAPTPRRGRPAPPEPLWALALDCLRMVPADRPADAGVVAERVRDWLDGVVQRSRARELVARARALDEDTRAQAADLRTRRGALDAARKAVPDAAPLEAKRSWWALEDGVRAAERALRVAEAERDQLLQTALSFAPDLPEAHAALADGYHRRHLEAEAVGDDAQAQILEGLLREHDAGRQFRGYLKGTARLRLRVAGDARATLAALRLVDRRLVPVDPEAVELPLDLELAHGSWLVTVHAPGAPPLPVPIWLGRGELWDQDLQLPSGLEDDACFVPAGPFWSGGDPDVPCLPRRRLWADAFVVDRFPVTNARYLAFLDDLVRSGREAEALRHAPRERAGAAGAEGPLIYGRRADGTFFLQPDGDGDVWRPDAPVLMVDWYGAAAFCAWRSERTGRPWRLPTEFEWEKAGRGVDGRKYPWGDHPDATWMCIRASHTGKAGPPPIDAYPLDVSPYGVRGLAGGVRDWCLEETGDGGPPTDGDRVVVPAPGAVDPEVPRGYRGGDWYGLAVHARLAYRAWNKPSARNYSLGFRTCRSA